MSVLLGAAKTDANDILLGFGVLPLLEVEKVKLLRGVCILLMLEKAKQNNTIYLLCQKLFMLETS